MDTTNERAKLTLLDRAVIWWNPSAGRDRVMAREQLRMFGYDAAAPGTKRGRSGGRMKNASSENWKTNRDRIALMWDARDMVRNFGILRGMVWRIVQYVIDRVQYVADTGDDAVNRMYQDYFHEWCREADITGRHRMGQLAWMAFWSMLVDGDHGWNLLEVPDRGETRLRLQAIESDRIGDPNNVLTSDPMKVHGIQLDEAGRPRGYEIYKRDRNGGRYDFEQVVPAEQFIFFFDPSRVDQYRGVTALAAALPAARDLYECYECEMQAAKWQIGHAGFIKNAVGQGAPKSAWEGDGPPGGGDRTYAMKAGMVTELPQGLDVVFAPGTSRPNGAFATLNEVLVRVICQTFNMPFGFMYDMTAFSGHTSRVEIAQAMRGVARYQGILAERFDVVRDAVLGRAIGLGELPPHPRWRAGRWGFGKTLTGDYGHDTTANLALLDAGVINVSDLIAETGKSFEDVVRRAASEVAYMQQVGSETGVPIELLTSRFPMATQMLAGMATPPPPLPTGLVEQGQDVNPLLKLLTEVGQGVIDRESAIATVMTMYGMSRAEAEAIVPEKMRNAASGAGTAKLGQAGRKVKKAKEEE